MVKRALLVTFIGLALLLAFVYAEVSGAQTEISGVQTEIERVSTEVSEVQTEIVGMATEITTTFSYTLYVPLMIRPKEGPLQSVTIPMGWFYPVQATGNITEALNMEQRVSFWPYSEPVGGAHGLVRNPTGGYLPFVQRVLFTFDFPDSITVTRIVSAVVDVDSAFYYPKEGQPNVPLMVQQVGVTEPQTGAEAFTGGWSRAPETAWLLEENHTNGYLWCNQLAFSIDLDPTTRDTVALLARSGIEDRPDLWLQEFYVHTFNWTVCDDAEPPRLTIWYR
jgi:hypothetical protein